ncbi:MAG: hypothetical protein Q8N16_03970 [bacterium]|nr:hypothetical protein [bacterium]
MAKRTIILLIVAFFLLVAVGITTFDSTLFSAGPVSSMIKNIIVKDKCQNIPAGNYDTKVKTHAPTFWEITCPWPEGKWSGKIAATTIPFGYLQIPTIRKGDEYSVETTLQKICATPVILRAGWSDICRVCRHTQYIDIDCSKVKIIGKARVEKITCPSGAYQADGKGNADISYQENMGISYQGGGLGSCSAKATYEGKLTGILGMLTVQKAQKK